MSSRIEAFLDGLIEAGWLAAVIIAPLFFNLFSARIFEPDKIALLRSLALIVLAAWLARLARLANQAGGFRIAGSASSVDLSQQPHHPRIRSFLQKLARQPLLLPVVFLAAMYLVSTLFSITPAKSLWGSYQRLQGTYTAFSYLVIFAALAANLRQRKQVERLLTVIILTSLPVSLYGILQHFHLDPVAWGEDASLRVSANLGNPIFLAAYLVMVFPLTAARLWDSISKISTRELNRARQVIRMMIYLLLFFLQITTIYLTGSRGPVLGWLAAIIMLLFLLAAWMRRRWFTYTLISLAGIVLVLGLIANLGNSPLARLQYSPLLGRFGGLINAESETALSRRYIWEGVADLVAPHPPLRYPDGRFDRWNGLRPFFGYGLESIFVAYNQFYVPDLGSVEKYGATPDRSHNETWDSLVTGGLLGFVAYAWLFSSIFYFGIKWLGLLRLSSSDNPAARKWLFWSFYVSGALLGGMLFFLWGGAAFLGIGIPFGMMTGLFGYVILTAIQSVNQKDAPGVRPQPVDPAVYLVISALFSALVSHFIEISFGIAISVTRLYFWVFVGIMLCLAKNIPGILESERETENLVKPGRVIPAWVSETLYLGGLLAIFLVTLGYDFLVNQPGMKGTLSILWSSLSRLETGAASGGILVLFAITWLAGCTLLALEELLATYHPPSSFKTAHPGPPGRPAWVSAAVIALVSLILSGFFWLLQAFQLANIARALPVSLAELVDQVHRYSWLFPIYLVFLLLLICWFAFFESLTRLSLPVTIKTTKRLSIQVLLGTGILIIGGILIVRTNIYPIRADTAFKSGQGFDKPGTYPIAVELYNLAHKLAKNEDYYLLNLAQAYQKYAGSITPGTEQDGYFARTAQYLKTAQGLNPLLLDYTANLARLYGLWALNSQDLTVLKERTSLADQYYSDSVALGPKNVRLWNEWAYFTFRLEQNPDLAQERLEHAIQIDPTYDWSYAQLGDLSVWRAEKSLEQAEIFRLHEEAVRFYRQSQALEGEPAVKYNVNLALADVFTRLELYSDAIVAYEQALTIQPTGRNSWKIQETLARLYLRIGSQAKALENALGALASVQQTGVAQDRARLEALIVQIQSAAP